MRSGIERGGDTGFSGPGDIFVLGKFRTMQLIKQLFLSVQPCVKVN